MKLGKHQYLKFFLIAISAAIIFSLISIIGYDILCFQPHRQDMKQLLSEADSENQHPSQIVSRLIDISSRNGAAITASVARNLLTRYEKASQYKMIPWHINYFFWNLLTYLHLSKEEIYAYYCLLSFNGKDYGANELSSRLFGKPLSKLDEQEAAMIVAILVMPSQSPGNQENIKKYQDLLLNEL